MEGFDPVSLTRSMSDVENPFLAPLSNFQPALHQQPMNQYNAAPHFENPPGPGYPIPFTHAELEESTYTYPPALYQQAQAMANNPLAMTSLGRGDTSTSLSLILTSLSRGNTEDRFDSFAQATASANAAMHQGINPAVAPFGLIRDLTGMSAFDDYGQAAPVNLYDSQPSPGTTDRSIKPAVGQSVASPSTASPLNQQQQPMHQTVNGYPMANSMMAHPISNQAVPQAAIHSPHMMNEYDHSRFAKRQRAELTNNLNQPSVPQSVPYFSEPGQGYGHHMNQAPQPVKQPLPVHQPVPVPRTFSQPEVTPAQAAKPTKTQNRSTKPSSSPQPNNHSRPPTTARTNSTESARSNDDSDSHLPSHALDTDDREVQKKVKHQMTDRQRRAKIKESMDQLKALVPLESNQKADQATIVAESVDLIKGMKDEIASLRAKIASLEMREGIEGSSTADGDTSFAVSKVNSLFPNSPLSALSASLNGAGVSLVRLSLDGRVLEVNRVFEEVTGFHGNDLVHTTPCNAPLYCSLSVIPKSFLRYFGSMGQGTSDNTRDTDSENSVSTPSSPNDAVTESSPRSPESSDSASDAQSPKLSSSSASTLPLFSSMTISSLPIVPHSELQSFFPFKCNSLADTQSQQNSMTGSQPHFNYLMSYLYNLPPHKVLKLLSRMSTSFGDTLESIQTMTLVRNSANLPHYILCLSTPEGRRLVKPARFLSNPSS